MSEVHEAEAKRYSQEEDVMLEGKISSNGKYEFHHRGPV